jgi:hypothetical protein
MRCKVTDLYKCTICRAEYVWECGPMRVRSLSTCPSCYIESVKCYPVLTRHVAALFVSQRNRQHDEATVHRLPQYTKCLTIQIAY